MSDWRAANSEEYKHIPAPFTEVEYKESLNLYYGHFRDNAVINTSQLHGPWQYNDTKQEITPDQILNKLPGGQYI